MKISKFRKYISWNIISLMGYFCSIVLIIFMVMYSLASTQIGMRADLNKYFFRYMTNNILLPYLAFYKIQILLIMSMLLASVFEHKHYKENGEYGLRLFDNHEKGYSILFTIGLALNLSPLYIFSIFIMTQIMKFF